MRELDRELSDDTTTRVPPQRGPERLGVVGRGRMGTALVSALREAGRDVEGPVGRGVVPAADAIFLCVPDHEIPAAAATVAGAAALVGHTSGATPVSALGAAIGSGCEGFALHPLQTLTGRGGTFTGCGCAVGGSTEFAAAWAESIALELGMSPFRLADEDRPAYHAAASVASNFLVTLEGVAESLAGAAGLAPERARGLLGPLVRTTVENWIELGPAEALTGPAARGDERTLAVQRRAVEAADPSLLPLFDALLQRTRELAAGDRARPRAAA